MLRDPRPKSPWCSRCDNLRDLPDQRYCARCRRAYRRNRVKMDYFGVSSPETPPILVALAIIRATAEVRARRQKARLTRMGETAAKSAN